MPSGLFGSLSGSAFKTTRDVVSRKQQEAMQAIGPNGEGYGTRPDGTQKGRGYLGEVPTPDGRVMTEYSVGVDFGNGEQDIPSLVPTLTPEQIQMVARERMNDEIIRKAVEFARSRAMFGLSPYAVKGFDY